MATKTDIVNIALRRIGANKITDIDRDTTKEAVAARDLYEEARKELLNLHTWNFATKRDQLEASATPPAYGWDYAYIIPDDLIRVVSVHPHDDDDASVPYKLEFQQGDDRVLLCDSNQVYLRYIFDQEDVNLMSPTFRDTLAWRMARDLAAALSKSTASAELADRAFRRQLTAAKAIDGQEDWPEKMADGDWLTSRFPDSRIIR